MTSCSQAGTFSVASDDVLQNRAMVKAKRRCNVSWQSCWCLLVTAR